VLPRAWVRRIGGRLVIVAVAAALIGCVGPGQPTTTGRARPNRRPPATPTSPGGQPSASPRPAAGPRPVSRRLIAARAHVPVLTYHQVRDWRPGDSPAARQLITPPAVFAAQMAALDRAGYTTISGTRLVDHLLTGAPLPAKPLLVSFDDASQGQYTNAQAPTGGPSWSGRRRNSAGWSAIGYGCSPTPTVAGPGRPSPSCSGPGMWRRSSWRAGWTRPGRNGPSGASWSPRPGAARPCWAGSPTASDSTRRRSPPGGREGWQGRRPLSHF
jgi:hypothetical protein